jgi:hypothetical protein
MERNDLEGLVSVYEGGFEEIQGILEDEDLTAREKVDAISDVVYGDEESESNEEADE